MRARKHWEIRATIEFSIIASLLGQFEYERKAFQRMPECYAKWLEKQHTPETMSENTNPDAIIPPCSLPCPKCGNKDINRRFRSKRETWDDYKPPRRENEFVAVDTYVTRAKKDCIQHKCRCCGWVWETAPLDAETPSVGITDTLPS